MKKQEFKSKKLNGLSKEQFHKQSEKAKKSYAASCVSQETHSKAGKLGSVQGSKNLEATRNTEGHQSKAAAAAGKANVESGWIKEYIKIGANAAKNKFALQRIEKLEVICAAMQPNVSYTYKQLKDLVDVPNLKNIICHHKYTEWQDYIIKECKGQGATATYKRR